MNFLVLFHFTTVYRTVRMSDVADGGDLIQHGNNRRRRWDAKWGEEDGGGTCVRLKRWESGRYIKETDRGGKRLFYFMELPRRSPFISFLCIKYRFPGDVSPSCFSSGHLAFTLRKCWETHNVHPRLHLDVSSVFVLFAVNSFTLHPHVLSCLLFICCLCTIQSVNVLHSHHSGTWKD